MQIIEYFTILFLSLIIINMSEKGYLGYFLNYYKHRDDINIISLACTIKRKNRKIIVVFSINLCFLILSFWGFSIMLFLICFFCHFITPIGIDYQYVTSNQQDFKKKIMMIVGACIFLVAAAQALPLFFGVTN